ncbi:geranylgeranylglycerol-phosphate geranylgeranyltransferase [Hymenobacter sp. BT186]|uniref:Geranylgeranylglycerol-phosphate geranylgeranyltransferase n=1 Tax=Hymenobacter telluris TaxID=2816474 RepID=A0A939EV20_9BACT|nr:geranylgeranylglycerol-phosphate geranylgeranyltransferase [Hymenobacter telluris]MBO0357752.1 geranylgeranylglycerol-phosphate geranylgeranyltransferase [Hymenobacter telluris]MBW3373779.1 geranylgeranylglycerol-phosphate geranylgeranyltransferase [Hymenobacter norwichensis]
MSSASFSSTASPAGPAGSDDDSAGHSLLLRPIAQLIRLPNLLIMLLCLVLVRAGLLRPATPLATLFDLRFGLLVLATLCIGAAGYIINDYYDVKIDAINRPGRLVVGRAVRRRRAMLAHLLLSGLGVGIGGLLSPLLGVVTLGSAVLLWGYSVRFKRVALVGNLSIATLTAALVLLPELQLRTTNSSVWAYALAAFLLTVVREIVKDVEDMRGDAQHDCRTLPIVWGVARTKWVTGFFLGCLLLLVLGAIGEALLHGPVLLGVWLLVLVLVPLLALLRLLWRADRRRHFAKLSTWCKGIMLAGVLSMLLVEVIG